MTDQASQLRSLVLRASRQREAESLPPPRMIGVLGANRSVGVTTFAAQLGRVLVEQGARVVLVDADTNKSDLAAACGVTETPTDYPSGVARRDIHEALIAAPGGLQIVPGVWEAELSEAGRGKASQQLLRQFAQLGRHADILVLDLGTCPADVLAAWQDALEGLLVVTTAANQAVVDTYSLIKHSLAGRQGRAVKLLVNQVGGEREASDVFQRLDRSCRRFLAFPIEFAGYVVHDQDIRSQLTAVAARLCEASQPREQRRVA